MKKKIGFAALAAAALALLLVGCGVKITSVRLPTEIILEKGSEQQLEIVFGADTETDQDKISAAAEKLTVEWTSADEKVATVDDTGMVTAVGAGKTDVTAAVPDKNLTATTHVKVIIIPAGGEAPEHLELTTNGKNTAELGAKMVPENATEVKLAYRSSDESVATVDETGLITAVADGECTITAYVTADTPATNETAPRAVVVTEPGEAESTENAADTEQAVMPDNLAELDSAFGVMPDGLSAETKVTVRTQVETIALDKTAGTLTVGGAVTLTAAVTPENATDPAVTWTSSDESVATVSETGVVQAIAPGKATITAASKDAPEVSASYELTVQQKKANTSNTAGTSSSPSAAASAPGSPEPAQPAYEEPAQSEQGAGQEEAAPSQTTPPTGEGGGIGKDSSEILWSPIDNDCPPEEHEVGWC